MIKQIKRAIISVSDKTQILTLAKTLYQYNIEILSTEGTATVLKNANIPVIKISDYTEFPEIMGGRIKTLHPKIHAGLLGQSNSSDMLMKQYGIKPIDLVIVNLYPFKKTIELKNTTTEEIIESIDIGGVTILRSAAKNYHNVTAVCSPDDYVKIIHELKKNNGQINLESRFKFACKAFSYTAHYEDSIANYFSGFSLQTQKSTTKFPKTINFQLHQVCRMRYGENPHQKSALYTNTSINQKCIFNMKQLQGGKLSYNNIVDTDIALKCIKMFNKPSCVIIKHGNPCGIACSNTIKQAYIDAFNSDSISAFGGIIACNRQLDETLAEIIIQKFIDIIIIPKITESALKIFSRKPSIRILIYSNNISLQQDAAFEFKTVNHGVLLQEQDNFSPSLDKFQVVTIRNPSDQELDDLEFAWKAVKYVKSNAIVYAKDNRTLGVGSGQTNRILSAKIAIELATKAKLETVGAVMASDAFLPFEDIVDFVCSKGITAIIQPGGSIRDQAIVDSANKNNIAMIFTGTRHFKH